MHRLLVRTIPRAGDTRVSTQHRAAGHARACVRFCTEAALPSSPSSSPSPSPSPSPSFSPRPSRVSLPPLPSIVTKDVSHVHYDRWVAALQYLILSPLSPPISPPSPSPPSRSLLFSSLPSSPLLSLVLPVFPYFWRLYDKFRQSPIFSARTYHPKLREPGFSVPIRDPKSDQEVLALVRRYSEVCTVTKGREALDSLLSYAQRVAKDIPDRELSCVLSALLASGQYEQARQLMDAYTQSGKKYFQPYEELLEYYFQHKDLNMALSLAQYLQQDTLDPPPLRPGAAFSIMAAHAHQQDVPALQLFLRRNEFTELQASHVEIGTEVIRELMDPRAPDTWPLSDQMWNLVLRGNADDITNELQKPGMDGISGEYYQVLMRHLAAHVPIDAWRKVQKFVAERGIQVNDEEFYNGCIAFGDAQRADEALRDMDTQGMKRTIDTYDALIYNAGTRGDLQACQQLLAEISEKLIAPLSRTFCGILDYWRSKGKVENILQFWDDMCRLQITPSPLAREKVKEVIYQYARKIDEEESQSLYQHIDTNDIPAHLAGLHKASAPEWENNSKRVMGEFDLSSRFNSLKLEQAKPPKSGPTYATSDSPSHGLEDYTYRDGTNLVELSNYFETNLQSTPLKTESGFESISRDITSSEVGQYDAMRRTLHENNKDTTDFLNKAMVVFQDYTKRWFNRILLDLAEDDGALRSEGYSALVHRAWKTGDRAECERLLAKISLNSVPETEEVTRIRQELFDMQPQQPADNNPLRDLLSELQKPQTELDIHKVQEMARLIAANFETVAKVPSPAHDATHEATQDAMHDTTNDAANDVAHAVPPSAAEAFFEAIAHPPPPPEVAQDAQVDSSVLAENLASHAPSAYLDPALIATPIDEDIQKAHVERKELEQEEKSQQQKNMRVSVAELVERMKQTNTMEDRAKVWELADQQFSEAKKYMFEKMITSCAQDGDLEGSIRLFKDMQNRGEQPTQQIYLTVIEAFAETDNLVEALDQFNEAQKMKVKLSKLKRSTRNALARAAASRGEVETFHFLVAEMYEAKMVPDPDVLYTLSINLAEQGDVTGSVQILEEIKTTHSVNPDALFNALVKTLTTSGNAEQRYKLIEEMAKRGIPFNASTLNILIYELIREGDAEASLLLVRELRNTGQDLDTLSEFAFAQYFLAAANAAGKREDLTKVSALMEEIAKGKEWVGANVYGTLIIKLLFFGLDKRAMRVFHDKKSLFGADWQNVILQQLAKRNSLRNHTNALEKSMRAAGMRFSPDTYAALIRAQVRDGSAHASVPLIEEAHRNKLDLDAQVYDELISALASKEDYATSIKIVMKLSETAMRLTPTALLVLLNESIRTQDTQSCVEVLSELRAMGDIGEGNISYVVRKHHNLPALIRTLLENKRHDIANEITAAHERMKEERANEENSTETLVQNNNNKNKRHRNVQEENMKAWQFPRRHKTVLSSKSHPKQQSTKNENISNSATAHTTTLNNTKTDTDTIRDTGNTLPMKL